MSETPSLPIVGQGAAMHKTFTVHVAIVQLEGSFLLLISDQNQFGIGTVTLSAPPSGIFQNATSSPLAILFMSTRSVSEFIVAVEDIRLPRPIFPNGQL